MKTRCVVCCLGVLLALVSPPSMAENGASSRQQPARMQSQVSVDMQYLIYLPTNHQEQEAWPLLLFLHGAGERGDNLDP